MQRAPIKPTLKPPGTKLLKPEYDEPLSNFAFSFNLRRYTAVSGADATDAAALAPSFLSNMGHVHHHMVGRCRLTLSNPR